MYKLVKGYSYLMTSHTSNITTYICGLNVMQDNSSPQEHASYVWKEFVKQSKAHSIDIVAHSFGGVVTIDLVSLINKRTTLNELLLGRIKLCF